MEESNPPPNIYIIGAQSTGKTTLVHALKCMLDDETSIQVPPPTIIKEVARKVLVAHDFKTHEIRDSPQRCIELQSLILKAQYVTEEAIEGWTISDRSAVDPVVYARQLVSHDAAYELRETFEWKALKEKMTKSLVVVCEAGVYWLEDDGTRLMPKDENEWMGFHKSFCEVLDEEGIPHIVVSRYLVDLNDRARFVLNHWLYLNGGADNKL